MAEFILELFLLIIACAEEKYHASKVIEIWMSWFVRMAGNKMWMQGN